MLCRCITCVRARTHTHTSTQVLWFLQMHDLYFLLVFIVKLWPLSLMLLKCDFPFVGNAAGSVQKPVNVGDLRRIGHQCSVCGKFVQSRAHLTIHMRSHTGEKPFVCRICGRGFSVKSSLKSHFATHMRDKIPL